jgi:hypothetical protein
MSTPTPLIRRDTRAWIAQTWLSFLLAVMLCVGGLAWLPGEDIDRAFMVMGYVFSLCSALVLAKTVRDQETRRSVGDTPLWSLVVWGGFLLAMTLTIWGLLRMGIQPVWKAYLVVAWLYLISSAFTLAKTLRDGYEASLQEARLAGRREASEGRLDSRMDVRLDTRLNNPQA